MTSTTVCGQFFTKNGGSVCSVVKNYCAACDYPQNMIILGQTLRLKNNPKKRWEFALEDQAGNSWGIFMGHNWDLNYNPTQIPRMEIFPGIVLGVYLLSLSYG